MNYINSEEHVSQSRRHDHSAVAQFIVPNWWEMALHNNTSVFVANALMHNNRNIVVSVLPFYLEDISFNQDEAAPLQPQRPRRKKHGPAAGVASLERPGGVDNERLSLGRQCIFKNNP